MMFIAVGVHRVAKILPLHAERRTAVVVLLGRLGQAQGERASLIGVQHPKERSEPEPSRLARVSRDIHARGIRDSVARVRGAAGVFPRPSTLKGGPDAAAIHVPMDRVRCCGASGRPDHGRRCCCERTRLRQVLPRHHHHRQNQDLTYTVTPLVSDQPNVARVMDPNLVNAWGLVASSTSPFWVANNGTSTSTLYDGLGESVPGCESARGQRARGPRRASCSTAARTSRSPTAPRTCPPSSSSRPRRARSSAGPVESRDGRAGCPEH